MKSSSFHTNAVGGRSNSLLPLSDKAFWIGRLTVVAIVILSVLCSKVGSTLDGAQQQQQWEQPPDDNDDLLQDSKQGELSSGDAARASSAPMAASGGMLRTANGGHRKLPPGNTYYLGFLYHDKMLPRYHLGAMTVALEHVNEQLKELGVTLGFYPNKTDGSKVKAIQVMTELRELGVHGFIGPSHTACVTEATVATAWNIPLISYHCQDKIVGVVDKTPTFVRTFPPRMKVVNYIMSIMRHYCWNKTVIFYGGGRADKKSPWLETVESLSQKTEVVDTKIIRHQYYGPRDRAMLEKMFDDTKLKTRVYIFLGEHDALIDFARYKHRTLGIDGREAEYVVIAVTEKTEAPAPGDSKFFLPFLEQSNTNVTKENIAAFRNVLLMYYRARPDEKKYQSFMEAAWNQSITEFGLFNSWASKYQIRKTRMMPEASFLYDAVFLYGRTLREALLNTSVDISDGKALAEMMKDRPYDSIQGYSINIDQNGDSMANYSVYSVTKVAHDREEFKISKIAQFPMSTNNSPQYTMVLGEDKLWINGPPKAIPECGLDGSECIPIDWKIPLLSSIGGLLAVAAVAVVFICRHYRYEQKLASLLWKVDIKDLIFTDADFNDPMMSDKPKRKPSARQSLTEADENQKNELAAAKFSGIRVATHRGSLVAVRFLKRRHVEVTRTMRKELHLLKELQHDNINRFIGACIDSPNICIITQYCSRGSLKEVIENDDLNLDDMFIASLVFDLIRGMIFLHDSEIGSHGNLKSTNCLVDSRWVLQIADFGISQLRCWDLPSQLDEDSYYGRLLWRAPELLRMPVAPPAGTQKADVYSFGIILFEIHGRAGPWGPSMYTAREIIEKVKFPPDGAILRPDTSLLKCECDFVVRCMKECWREIPENRPDFKYIRMKLKPMQRGLKPNIFDNMLAMMGKYADNLEAIVASRTEQLVEEKKKTEALLLRMLPKYVAEELKKGNPVVPEHFGSVTIYFSDVVGFTAICAESTPLEVVDMLNDLYTCFDSIIGEYDVYKVETIGDAYMVVSGLPLRNGDNHAGEIASMSLHLLRAIGNFRIRHRPGDRLSLRIGIHSGSVVTGVVGLKMPRYCLFGDTVNTTSRMESNGEPMKIHCSSSCRNLLTKLGGYKLEERGYINMKGKGEMFTYFLEGEDKSYRMRRISVERRPLSLDSSTLNNLHAPSMHSRLRGSTTSLRSEDSAAAATESLRHLLNGNIPAVDFRGSITSMESQV